MRPRRDDEWVPHLFGVGDRNGDGGQDYAIYDPWDGFTGWDRVTRTDNPDDKELKSCSIEYIGTGFFGERIFLRGFANGTVEQATYDPENGQSRWTELPGG